MLSALVHFALLILGKAYSEPFNGSVGPEVQEASNATFFSEFLSTILLDYRDQAV